MGTRNEQDKNNSSFAVSMTSGAAEENSNKKTVKRHQLNVTENVKNCENKVESKWNLSLVNFILVVTTLPLNHLKLFFRPRNYFSQLAFVVKRRYKKLEHHLFSQ